MNEQIPRYVDLWLATLRINRRSIENYKTDLLNFVGWANERALPVVDASPADLLAYKADLRGRDLSVRTITRRMQVLVRFAAGCNPSVMCWLLPRPPSYMTRRRLLRANTSPWATSPGSHS